MDQSTELKSYKVRVIRPVFEATVVDVEARSEIEAIEQVKMNAFDIPDEQWSGKFDPENYYFDGHLIETSRSEEGHEFSSLANFPLYCLLQADFDLGAGTFVLEPWVNETTPLLLADFCSDWNVQLRGMRNDSYDEAFEPVADLLELIKDNKVGPSAAGRQSDIENLTAVLDTVEKMKDRK